jgi:hypothetical protein
VEVVPHPAWKRFPKGFKIRNHHLGVYRPGVLIRFVDDTGYFLAFKDSQKVIEAFGPKKPAMPDLPDKIAA